MKKLTKINLLNLSQAELAKRESTNLKGGALVCYCKGNAYCGCKYAGPKTDPDDSFHGGSSTVDNSNANTDMLITDVNHDAVVRGVVTGSF